MLHMVFIETVLRDRERETRDDVRRRQLVAGEGPDPSPAHAAAEARASRREQRAQPARLMTP